MHNCAYNSKTYPKAAQIDAHIDAHRSSPKADEGNPHAVCHVVLHDSLCKIEVCSCSPKQCRIKCQSNFKKLERPWQAIANVNGGIGA
jgi:hypothetical protein